MNNVTFGEVMINEFGKVMAITRDVSSHAALTDTECRAFWNEVCVVPREGLVVEVGCQYGRSSSLIAQGRRLFDYHNIHIDPYIVGENGIDTPQPHILEYWAKMMLRVSEKFALLCMKTQEAEWYLDLLCRNGIDLAFIDGDHERQAVEIDMALVGSRVKPGGVMMCHDCTHPHFHGLREAIDSFTAQGWSKEGQHDSLGIWRRL